MGKEKSKRPDKVMGSSIRRTQGDVRIKCIIRASSTEPWFTQCLNPSSQQICTGIGQVIISYTIQSRSKMGEDEGAIAWRQ